MNRLWLAPNDQHGITLMVIEIRGDKVRLGIEAPRDVTVHREEVYDAIRREAAPDPKS